eukprot:4599989-Prymnesium_polylepis.3
MLILGLMAKVRMVSRGLTLVCGAAALHSLGHSTQRKRTNRSGAIKGGPALIESVRGLTWASETCAKTLQNHSC